VLIRTVVLKQLNFVIDILIHV